MVNMKAGNFNLFTELFKADTPKEQIIKTLKISNRTYYRYCNRFYRVFPKRCNNVTIRFKDYYYVITKCKCTSKKDIANKLGISERMLYKIENNGMLKKAVQFLYINNYSSWQIADLTKTNIQTVAKITMGCLCKNDLLNILTKYINILQSVSELDNAIFMQISTLKRIKEKL